MYDLLQTMLDSSSFERSAFCFGECLSADRHQVHFGEPHLVRLIHHCVSVCSFGRWHLYADACRSVSRL